MSAEKTIVNRVLCRQLRREGLTYEQLPVELSQWQGVLDRVAEAYEQDRKDRYLMERSLALSSSEMQTVYDELRTVSAQQLIDERDQFQRVIDGFPNGFCRLDLDGLVESANCALLTLLGEDLVGENILSRLVLDTDARDILISEPDYRRQMNDRSTFRCASALVKVGAVEIPVSVLIYPIIHSDRHSNRVIGAALVFEDISERKRTELQRERERQLANLRASIGQTLQLSTELSARMEKSLEALLDNEVLSFLDWACVCQIDLEAESPYQSLHCLASVGVGAKGCQSCLDSSVSKQPKDALGGHSFITTPLRSGRTLHGYLFTSVNMESMEAGLVPEWLSNALAPISSMMAITIADDIAQKKAEHARESALALARSKSNFLANMSHEIRTPMNGVIGMLDMLKDSALDKEQTNSLNIAYDSAESLLTIINDILDVSRIEAGKLHIDHVNCDLRRVVEDVAELFSSSAEAKGLELLCHLPTEMQSAVIGDPIRLRQILNNLIGNAIKFTAKGQVMVRLEQEYKDTMNPLKNRGSGQWINTTIWVEDTGIGIETDKLPTLFQPFSQADSSITRQFGGTGLGLSISKQLAELMKGSLTAESQINMGSRFSLTLPCEVQAEASEISHIDAGKFAGRRILLVGKNQDAQAILQDFMCYWQATYVSTRSGEEAMAALRQAFSADMAFDTVITDSITEDIDGLSLATRIRQHSNYSNTQIILLTSDKLRADPALNKVVKKPVRYAYLYEALLANDDSMPSSLRPSMKPEEPWGRHDIFQGYVLLVEDNVINQVVAQKMLTQFGLTVDIADNGEIALKMTRENDYDLVIMDCNMPVMGGIEATQQIRRRGGDWEALPIVAMTANVMEGDKSMFLESGMSAYVSKPVTVSSMIETLRASLPARCICS